MAFLENIFHTKKILDDRPFMFFFLNLANHIEFFSKILKLDVDLAYMLLNINHIPIRKIPPRVFPVLMFYVAEKFWVLKS